MRPTWDEYFLNMLPAVGARGTCNRGKSGSLVALDNRIISAGYVGSPPGEPHCDDVGHHLVKRVNADGSISEHCIRTLHAERNAIDHIPTSFTKEELARATIYSTMTPCIDCARRIVESGIRRVVASKDYHRSAESKVLFLEMGVELIIIDPEVQKY